VIVIMRPDATPAQLTNVVALIEQMGCQAHISRGERRTLVGIIGNGRPFDTERIEQMPGVEQTTPVTRPFKRASREFHPQDTLVAVGDVTVGGGEVTVIAGPCAVESQEQMSEIGRAVVDGGAQMLRGGAYKPRTSPYSFQGLGEEGLRILARVRDETGLPIVTEVIQPELVPLVTSYADVLQIGARNMQNFALLHAVGQAHRPVLLKRGMMSTVEELLMAAEYILSHGNDRVILCERGIRTFETYTRNTLDINAVPLLKQLTHLPVVVDPSHGTGMRDLVEPVSRAAVAAGADGLIVEVHHRPEEALSDGSQSLLPEQFVRLRASVDAVASAIRGAP
jgi:3-deoxy-7-phosphoheptulonate synthase